MALQSWKLNGLAVKLRNNWLAKHPAGSKPQPTLDDSLTNLDWLYCLTVSEPSRDSTPPSSPGDHEYASGNVDPNDLLRIAAAQIFSDQPVRVKDSYSQLGSTNYNNVHSYSESADIDYRNSNVKPPYSYASMIRMAMKANNNKVTLSMIYDWICDNFLYYATACPNWQVSKIIIYLYYLIIG